MKMRSIKEISLPRPFQEGRAQKWRLWRLELCMLQISDSSGLIEWLIKTSMKSTTLRRKLVKELSEKFGKLIISRGSWVVPSRKYKSKSLKSIKYILTSWIKNFKHLTNSNTLTLYMSLTYWRTKKITILWWNICCTEICVKSLQNSKTHVHLLANKMQQNLYTKSWLPWTIYTSKTLFIVILSSIISWWIYKKWTNWRQM